ncbi:hypothetical protein BH10BAC1_BH10BAC1_03710 [soil metagenome]
MKNTLIFIALLFSSNICFSQSLIPTVVGSSGASGTSASGNIDWTVGEIMTETFTGTNIITQGFHQPWINISTSVGTLPSVLGFDVYPNPVSDYLNVHFSGAGNLNYTFDLYDSQGRLVLSKSMEGMNSNIIEMNELSAGIYYLKIYDTGNYTGVSFTISKIK